MSLELTRTFRFLCMLYSKLACGTLDMGPSWFSPSASWLSFSLFLTDNIHENSSSKAGDERARKDILL